MPTRSPGRQPAEVIITVRHGVADVHYKTRGLLVSIYDYDMEGEDAAVSSDPDGRPCSISQWEPAEVVSCGKDWPMIRRPARGTRQGCSSRWRCPRCGRTVKCSCDQFAEAGTPYCADCDAPMERV